MWNTCRRAWSDNRQGTRLERSSSRSLGLLVAVVMAVTGVLGCSLDSGVPVADAQTDSQQRGFALPTWQVNGYDGPGLEQSLKEVKALGATWVQFTPTWYQTTRYSSRMFRTARTVSDAGLTRAITLAHRQRLKVFLKPHIDLPVAGVDSRNNIRPVDGPAWFAAYTGFIGTYATLAQRLGVEQFSVGTELSSVSHDREAWLGVIHAVRTRYRGVLTYASGRDWVSVPFWDALDLIGVDAYVPLGRKPTSDVKALERGWQRVQGRLAALSAKYGRKILFTEAGFTSQRGTITDPSDWRVSKTQDQAEQAAGYHSLLATFSQQPWWAGVHWWVWIAPPDAEAEPLDFSPRGKMAEDVVRRWWAS